jgi:hypothetical protein
MSMKVTIEVIPHGQLRLGSVAEVIASTACCSCPYFPVTARRLWTGTKDGSYFYTGEIAPATGWPVRRLGKVCSDRQRVLAA